MARELFQPKVKIVTGPAEGGALRELWTRCRRPVVAVFWGVRNRWLLHRGLTRAGRWRNPFRTTVGIAVTLALALVLVWWAGRGLWVVILSAMAPPRDPPSWLWKAPDGMCQKVGASCGAVTGVVLPVLALAASTVLFLAWRLWRVRRYCTRGARTEPKRLVQTAGSLMDEVVGRDQLCNAIMNNLRDRRARRPHVVVGKVGSGKTALLVRLTEQLAAKGAVPIPIRLRDADTKLDFCELARARFEEIVQPRVRSGSETDRLWRWLRQRADRIVVLADGLEEALNQGDVRDQRDNRIREAIRRAGEERLPLVIASRPHDPLGGMQAAVTELEPLSHEAALRYIGSGGSWRSNPMLLDRVVEVAKVVDSPLYLQIARDLQQKDLLESLWTENGTSDPMLKDTWALRADLLERWLDALVDAEVRPELPLGKDARAAVVDYISALACIGLASDRSEVPLWELDPFLGPHDDGEVGDTSEGLRLFDTVRGQELDDEDAAEWNERVAEELDERLTPYLPPPCDGATPTEHRMADDARPNGLRMDVKLAATWGTRMGLVHEWGGTVHFQHSVMQAYLGSRFFPCMFGTEPSVLQVERGLWQRASSAVGSKGTAHPSAGQLREKTGTVQENLPVPRRTTAHIAQAINRGGRELLIAFMLFSRSHQGRCTCPDDGERALCPAATLRALLWRAAEGLLEEADETEKLQERRRAAATAAGRRDNRGRSRIRALDIYATAVDIDSIVTLPAHADLVQAISNEWGRFERGENPAALREAKLTLVRQWGSAARRVARHEASYRHLFKVGSHDRDPLVRAEIVAEIGNGSDKAFCAIYEQLDNSYDAASARRPPKPTCDGQPQWPPRREGSLSDRERRARQRVATRWQQRDERWMAQREAKDEWEKWHQRTMGVWILPRLVDTSPMTSHLGTPRAELERLTREVTGVGCPHEDEEAAAPARARSDDGTVAAGSTASSGTRIGLGLALAQGFKYAANRRPGPRTNQESREFLIKQAQELLRRSTHWYTRLTLLQALTLWALPDDVRQDRPIRGPGADPSGQVCEWLARSDGHGEHPLVEAAGRLAVRALQTRRPERFLWIDAESTSCTVGTEVSTPGEQRAHDLWIPPATGWSTLDPTAQQLLADVTLLQVLEERDHRPKDLIRLLEQRDPHEWSQLPSCLSRDRTRLNPARAVEHRAQPGAHCTTNDCHLRMCPYPAKAQHLRMEFSEVFCLRQRDLLKPWQPRAWLYLRFRREAWWQRGVHVSRMRRFWDEMGRRARDDSHEVAVTRRAGDRR
ncbi:NACHT domain-containing protein [Streptomyces sp. NPDC004647]|uniref:NACHT domain-containing protein n=1 Tax=Streptomyces sp. NPDC004647 TaxID=3154671 RepID=UPI0033A70548